MTFTEGIMLWWLLTGLYYVLDTSMQDLADKPFSTVVFRFIKNMLLLPVMPIMVAFSLVFNNLVMIGVSHETEE